MGFNSPRYSNQVICEVLVGELVRRKEVEGVAVDLDIAADGHICQS